MVKDTTVILPIAGKGKRFWPLSNKHFFPFLSKPLIHYPFAQIEKYGFRRVVLVVNKENKKQAEKLSIYYPKLSIKTVLQKRYSGLAAAILAAASYLRGEIVVLSPHDVVEDSLFSKLVKEINKQPQSLVIGKKMDRYFPGGYLVIENGVVRSIIEKPRPSDRPGDVVALVYYYFNKGQKLLQTIKSTPIGRDDGYERAVSTLLKQGFKMKPVLYSGYWGYLKHPWDVLQLMDFFLGKLKRAVAKTAVIDQTAVVSGSVVLEDGVNVCAHASIIGPAYIGKGVVIGNNALVRQAHIGSHSVVGFATEVARSYVGSDCWFHTNYIGDSVIGKNVAIGAGAVLANLRLDEAEISSNISHPVLGAKSEKLSTGRTKLGSIIGDHVRIGVNSSIMPGIKIGTNSSIGPQVLVYRDIPDGKACFMVDKKHRLRNSHFEIRHLARKKMKVKKRK